MPINYIGNDITVKYIDGRVEFFADLPLATENADKVYIVEKSSGVIFINRHKAGLYYSNGTAWEYMPNSVQADFVLYNNASSLLTATDIQAAIDEMRTVPTWYHGVVTLPTITDNTDGTVSIGAGAANFAVVADGDGAIVRANTPAESNIALTDGTANYIYADYNAGSPTINVATSPAVFITDGRLVPIYRVVRQGVQLCILDYDEYGIGLADKAFYKDIALRGAERQTGLILSTAATRISTVSAGSVWFGVEQKTLPECVAGTDALCEFLLTAGVWSKNDVTEYDSQYYSDGTDRQTLSANRWVAKYFFRSFGSNKQVSYIHGNQYTSASAALAELLPAVPPVVQAASLYVGKIVIQQGATNGTAYPRAWGEAIQSSGAVNHNDLANRDVAGNHAKIIPLVDSITAIQITKADGTTVVLNVDTVNNSVGIGTGAPEATASLTLDRSIFNQLFMKVGGVEELRFYADAALSSIASLTNPLLFETGGSERMRITSSGNVGIGVTPVNKFAVYGDDTQTGGIRVYRGAVDTVQWMDIYSAGGRNIIASVRATTALSSGMDTVFSNIGSDGTRDNLVIKGGTGRVGIGTTSPIEILNLNGNLALGDNSRSLKLIWGTRVGTYIPSGMSFDLNTTGARSFGLWTNGMGAGTANSTSGYPIEFDGKHLLLMNAETDGNVGIGTTTPGAKLDVNGFTKLGSDAPAIKMKKLTGTTNAAEGGSISVAHGLTSSKIISMTAQVFYTETAFIGNGGYSFTAGFQFDFTVDATNINVLNHPTNSENILSKPFVIVIWYEE